MNKATVKLILGRNLRRVREKAGISIVKAAMHVDVHPSTITRWETGHAFPGVDQLYELLDYFDADDLELSVTGEPGDIVSLSGLSKADKDMVRGLVDRLKKE